MAYEDPLQENPSDNDATVIDIAGLSAPGLYLLFPDGNCIDLKRETIEATTEKFLADPSLIPDSVKAATDYKACAICPERHTARICHAIMPMLPFIEQVSQYMSYHKVTAVYRDADQKVWHVRQTTMQQALQCIALLSLTEYCEVGHSYARYFKGVNPLMPADQIAEQAYRNIYFEQRGYMTAVRNIITRMREEISHTSACQIKRLRLICSSDAFINAFVNTQMSVEWILVELQEFAGM